MAAEPVRHGFEEHRSFALTHALDGLCRGVAHGQHVHTVDLRGGYPVRLGGQVNVLAAGVGQLHVGAHAVQVVFQEEDHRQPPERGEIERLVELALVDCAVAEEAHRDPPVAAVLAGKGETRRDGQLAADDGVAAHEIRLRVEKVHRAALSPAAARGLAVQLGHNHVRVHALGQRVTVVAVVAHHVVRLIERGHGAGGDGLLADVQVQESPYLALCVQSSARLLESANKQHHPVILGHLALFDFGCRAHGSIPTG